MQNLSDLASQMEEIAGWSGADPEVAHGDADGLLCEAILILGGDAGERLVAAFNGVDKWYA